MKETIKFRGVIFDLNGVLVDTDRYDYEAWRITAEAYGIGLTREIHRHLRGLSREASLEVVLRETGSVLPDEKKERLSEEKNALYRALLQGMSPADVTDEVRETLDALRRRGYALAVGSSSQNGVFILERTGLSGLFDAVCDGRDISRAKPDPEVFLLAAQRLGIPPGRCLVVEDAVPGAVAARRGGMKAACLADAAAAGAGDYDLKRFSDLLEILN